MIERGSRNRKRSQERRVSRRPLTFHQDTKKRVQHKQPIRRGKGHERHPLIKCSWDKDKLEAENEEMRRVLKRLLNFHPIRYTETTSTLKPIKRSKGHKKTSSDTMLMRQGELKTQSKGNEVKVNVKPATQILPKMIQRNNFNIGANRTK